MSDLTETCEAIATYYKAITIWRWTDQQELQTLSFQLSNEDTVRSSSQATMLSWVDGR